MVTGDTEGGRSAGVEVRASGRGGLEHAEVKGGAKDSRSPGGDDSQKSSDVTTPLRGGRGGTEGLMGDSEDGVAELRRDSGGDDRTVKPGQRNWLNFEEVAGERLGGDSGDTEYLMLDGTSRGAGLGGISSSCPNTNKLSTESSSDSLPVARVENLAVDGAATQSSKYGDGFAEKAIDRGLQQLYTGCSSTLNETNPWWRLDLRHIYSVSEVVVTNRKDCCAEQINGAEIHIGNSLENNGNNNPICAVIPAIPAGESYNYSCNGMEGRYVNLIIPGDMKILTLCEVKVYGEGPCLKRSFVKMQFNSRNDLTDPSMIENLGSALADRGLTDVTLRWSQAPQTGHCENRNSP
ncbi:uncharacterized protein [Chanodichthys erythropterus]|uniref:uncharacterized protein n=1 Tax=Chanodichthys erythropterus TaxID=933992 RepID=UPI00351E03E1